MFKKYSFLVLAAVLASQAAFADMSSEDKTCEPIVKACLDAGYGGNVAGAKQFWMDCMEPLILGKTVAKTSVPAADIKACRTTKIQQLKDELAKMEKANS